MDYIHTLILILSYAYNRINRIFLQLWGKFQSPQMQAEAVFRSRVSFFNKYSFLILLYSNFPSLVAIFLYRYNVRMSMFNQDSGFVKFVNRALDVIYINILWLVFSLPVITMGAATSAAFYVTLKMVDDEEGYIFPTFWKGFKSNFKQSTIMWCITAPCLYLGWLMWQYIIKGDAGALVIIGAIVYSAIVIVTNIYTYPLMARYENSLKQTVKNSFGICMQYFTKTLFMIFIIAIEIGVFVILTYITKWALFAALLFGVEFVIYTISGMCKPIFIKIENTNPTNDDETGTINQ